MRDPLLIAAMALALVFTGSALADDTALKGREILTSRTATVVTVQLVLKQKISMPGRGSRESESKNEATGTVIGPDGLTVLSLSETDPSSIFAAVDPGGGSGVTMETKVLDVRLLFSDDTEFSAEIVLRDVDLDMAFIRPKEKPPEALAYVDLKSEATAAVLDEIIALNRLGTVLRRVHTASVERIEAVIHKPRTFYVPGNDLTQTRLGSPAFTLDNEFIGVFLMRAVKGTGGNMSDSVATILLPAADIREAAGQVPPFE